MKVIFANKYHYMRGGAERYAFDLATLFARHGIESAPFSMRTERDEPTPWERYFVSSVRTDHVSFGWQGLRTAGRFLYSVEARRRFSQLVQAFSPDILHVHNIYHQISPSILPVAKKRKLPVVMTAHDYALLAPNYSLFHDGAICEVTKPDNFFRAVAHRCVGGSSAASWLAATELSLHHRLGLYRDNIDRIITPSRFMEAMFLEYGWPAEKLVHIPHFIDAADWQPSFGGGDYVLFVGRFSPEKGVDTLIRAAAKAKHVPVRLVGDGPDNDRLRKLAADLGASNVEFRGFRVGSELREEYRNARFLVIPSVWYEVFGLVAFEAYASGKPVVVSEIGGLSEVIKPGETGVPVSVGEPDHLAEVLDGLWNDPIMCERMGRAGHTWIQTEFSPDRHFSALMSLYADVGVEVPKEALLVGTTGR